MDDDQKIKDMAFIIMQMLDKEFQKEASQPFLIIETLSRCLLTSIITFSQPFEQDNILDTIYEDMKKSLEKFNKE